MRIYYRSQDAVVTSEHFIRRDPSAKSYAVRELRNAGIATVRGNDSRRHVGITAAGLLGIVAGAVTMSTDSPSTFAALALSVSVATTTALLWQRRPRRWQLRALYRGKPVILYASCDPTVFHQVARALQRAMEDRGYPREPDDAAA